jgi:Rieske Fe-S protein
MSKSGLFALSPVCTHLGCLVNWDYNKKEFICPCHGGKYDMEGKVRGGPPPAPLNRLPLEVRDEKVYIGMVL